MRECIQCGGFKQEGDYYNNPLNKDGIYDICKECFDLAVNQKETARQIKKQKAKNKVLRQNSYYYIIRKAKTSGKLKKQPCEQCGSIKNIHAHHEDYSKPLEVVWLCHKCHFRLHKKNRRKNDNQKILQLSV